MTIHKSAAPLSSALERRRCHVLSPQKGAAIDCGGYEREISRDSTPGPVSGHMQEDGGGASGSPSVPPGARNQEAERVGDRQRRIPFHMAHFEAFVPL